MDNKMLEYIPIEQFNTDKKVLIFYHIWHAAFMHGSVSVDPMAPRNINKILQQSSDALKNSHLWGPNISYHYWGEPLFGYYDIAFDDYVIRKHVGMLNDCGVDGIVIDYTNYMGGRGLAYCKEALSNLLNVFSRIRDEGGNTPYVTFLCTWDAVGSERAVHDLYEDYYTNAKYERLWFKWKDKPLILAHPGNLNKEIKSFFTTRKPFPFYTAVDSEDTWPWLSIYPQEPGYTKDNKCEVVSVGCAQNWSSELDFMSAQDENGMFIARGRSYTHENQKLLNNPISEEYESEKGANFIECFKRAIELDPEVILVTGFNEWIAARFLEIPDWAKCSKDKVMPFGGFCDCFTTEFSRDIEPTRDGNLKDSFYMLLTEYIRKFKSIKKKKAIPKQDYREVLIDGKFDDWDNATQVYYDDINDIAIRDAKGIGQKVYINDTGRNDFKTIKVNYDKEHIYFYVETVNDISSCKYKYWMNLFIHVSSELPNWEGYNFVINRTNVRKGYTCLEKSTGGFSWELVTEDIPYRVEGNRMEMAIRRESLGLDKRDIRIMFKYCDNTLLEGDILNFYLNGDCAPNGRFNYLFEARG